MYQLARISSSGQKITVYEANHLYGETGRYRFLQFAENAVQGAIDLKDRDRIVLEYPRAIVYFMEHNHPTLEHVFIIGHGIGTIAGHFPENKCTVAEVDAEVVELSRTYFGYHYDNVVIGDGRQILRDEEDGKFDYIIVDAFTQEGTPYHLTTEEFFIMTREKLTSRGAIMMNLNGTIRNDRNVSAIHTSLKETYAYTKAFALRSKDMADERNIILIGRDIPIDSLPEVLAGFVEIELEEGHIIKDRE